jgi:hypothetical protein
MVRGEETTGLDRRLADLDFLAGVLVDLTDLGTHFKPRFLQNKVILTQNEPEGKFKKTRLLTAALVCDNFGLKNAPAMRYLHGHLRDSYCLRCRL